MIEKNISLEDLMQEIKSIKSICNENRVMIQYLQGDTPTNLDNCTSSDYNAMYPSTIGGNMASKFRQRVKVGVDADNKPLYQWACGSTQDELNERIVELLTATEDERKKSNCPRWEEYAHRWFQSHKTHLRPKTADTQEALFRKHVEPMFAGKRINEIRVFDVTEALSAYQDYAHSYVRDIISMLKNIFASATEDKIIKRDENPMESRRVKNPSHKKTKERKPLSQEEQEDIIIHLSDLKNPSDKRFMSFLMFTCLTPSEILGLRWEDINMAEGLIYVERALTFSKGKAILGEPKEESRKRVIPIDPRLLEHISPMQKEGFIVCRIGRGHDGEHYTEEAQKRAWERIKKQINLHGMTAYIGRHTYATNMSKAGVPLKVAMKIMGHVDERMMMKHYVHTDIEDLRQAGAIMAGFVGNVQPA